MNNLSGRLVVYLVGAAAIFVILFGIRGSAYIINPILLATVITITVLPVPSRLTKRGMPGWLALVLSILLVVLLLGLVIATIFFSITKLSTELPVYMTSASQQASEDLSTTTDPETTLQIEQVTTSLGPVAQSVLASTVNLLVQFGLALAIFFFMISAALALPTPSRLGLDPNAPTVGRVTALTEDVRKYMTVLTGVAYSAGSSDFAGVSTPPAWNELGPDLHPEDFTVSTFGTRLAQVGDLWAPGLGRRRVDLREVLEKMGSG